MPQNEFGQPIGEPLPQWRPAGRPKPSPLNGETLRLEPMQLSAHVDSLYAAFSKGGDRATWTYLSYGPFERAESFRDWVEAFTLGVDPCFYAWVVDGRACGFSSFMRIQPEHGAIEIGHVALAPELRRTRAATEGFFLMMQYAFEDLGNRRLEWKCDALNAASRSAAERLGFRFEGVFRQALVYKQRNRDTAWYSIIDQDWPEIRNTIVAWLDPSNFDADGRQRRTLSGCR